MQTETLSTDDWSLLIQLASTLCNQATTPKLFGEIRALCHTITHRQLSKIDLDIFTHQTWQQIHYMKKLDNIYDE